MKNLSAKILVCLFPVVFMECSVKEESINLSEDRTLLEKYKPDLISAVDFASKEIYETDNGKIVSYKIINNTNTYLFKDYTDQMAIISVLPEGRFKYTGISDNVNFDFETTYNETFKTTLVDLKTPLSSYYSDHFSGCKSATSCEAGYTIDVGLCLVSAAAIAASDGPLPFADAVAVSYGVACIARAADTFGNCLNNQ